MAIITKYLIVTASEGDARVVTRKPSPTFGEVVYRLKINVPESWKAVRGEIELTLPEASSPLVSVEEEDDWWVEKADLSSGDDDGSGDPR